VSGRILLALALLVAAAAPAAAHTGLVASRPADGRVLHAAPTRVTLTFSSALGRPGTMTVDGPAGKAAIPARLERRDARRMTAPLEDQGAGAYAVTWTAVAADGHELGGEIVFTVRPPDAARAVAVVAARVASCVAVLRRHAGRAAARTPGVTSR
jgi:methionine-rich copper-binding protein CopC